MVIILYNNLEGNFTLPRVPKETLLYQGFQRKLYSTKGSKDPFYRRVKRDQECFVGNIGKIEILLNSPEGQLSNGSVMLKGGK